MKTIAVMAFVLALQGLAAGQSRSTTACVQPGHRNPQLLPVDEGSSRPGFRAYRARLQAAVTARDVGAVMKEVDPGVRLGFDAAGGIDRFTTLLAERPELWDELRVVLRLGGSFSSPAAFEAPYVFAEWPDRFDSFECAAITGRNVRLRSAPRLDAPIVAVTTHSIVQLLDRNADGKEWSRVRLGDGRTGYVWRAYVRSPIDHRALFNLSDGRWRMTAFVAGD